MSPLIKERVDVALLIEELLKLGWKSGKEYGIEGFRREIVEWSVFERIFRNINSLDKLFKQADIDEILNTVKERLGTASAVDILNYLKYGITVRVRGRPYTFALIDYDNLSNNLFLFGREIEFPGFLQNSRPDLVLYVNGIPLVVIEVKPHTGVAENALNEGLNQLSRYEKESPDLFRFVQLGIVYIGREESVFRPTLPNYAGAERFIPYSKWKPPDSNQYDILDLLKPERLLSMIRWYTFYKGAQGDKKIMARYMQYRASERVLKRVDDYLQGRSDKNRGLVWHWQGTGKTYTMFFIAHKFYKRYYDRDPIVFFIVDRRELQRQLYEEFVKDIVAPYFTERIRTIESIGELRDLLKSMKESEQSKHRIERGVYIVLIQKFRPSELADLEPIFKEEILVLIDEAHRSQYGILGATLNRVLPRAIKIAFTGTPVLRYERNTFQYFSYPEEKELYIDRYFISDSVSDGYTVPLVYQVVTEKGGVRILVDEEEIRGLITTWLKNAEALGDLDEYVDEEEGEEEGVDPRLFVTKQEIRRRINRIKVFLENEKRLGALAEYIASRIEDDTEGFKFKAMVVTASRHACIVFKRLLDEALVRRYGEEARQWSEVVISYGHNDPPEILKYRDELLERWRRIGVRDPNEVNKEIQEAFKERDDPRILIVTDMLITGFDCPRLKVMYLDKPIYEHKLLQTMARVNRPFTIDGVKKQFGLIVDSVGLVKHAKETILTYNYLGDEKIVEDISRGLVRDAEAVFSEFLVTLQELKKRLKEGISIGTYRVSIDLDELKNLNEVSLRNRLEGDVEPQLKMLALRVNTPECYQVLELMKKTLDLFVALGAHPKKLDYIKDYNLIRWMYEYVWSRVRGRKPPREFWDYIIKHIHERSSIGPFAKIEEGTIDESALIASIDELERRLSMKTALQDIASDLFLGLRSLMELEPANPLYKHIHERLKELEDEWIARGDVSALKELLDRARYIVRYREESKKLSKEERIINDVKQAIAQKYNVEVDLKHFKEALTRVAREHGGGEFFESQEKELRIALLKDLAKQVRGVDAKERAKFVDDVIAYVKKVLVS